MKTFVMMVLNTITSALIGALAMLGFAGLAEYEGEDVLDGVAVTTKKKAYEEGRRDGVRQAKEEIMANLRAD
jgi:hypothetical protein